MSVKLKHTKYKVVFEKNETRPCKMYISSGNRNLVASVNNDPETVAMFQLFAAAPEMLEALEALMPWMDLVLQRTMWTYDAQWDQLNKNAKRAIAKAKGEQP